MKFIIRTKKAYKGYRVTLEEYSDDLKKLINVDKLAFVSDITKANEVFNKAIARINMRYFKLIECSSIIKESDQINYYMLFQDNIPIPLAEYLINRNKL